MAVEAFALTLTYKAKTVSKALDIGHSGHFREQKLEGC